MEGAATCRAASNEENIRSHLERNEGVLLEEIVETERQLLLWEKKIQLERETQAALDPEVGMAEIKAMEKEHVRGSGQAAMTRRDRAEIAPRSRRDRAAHGCARRDARQPPRAGRVDQIGRAHV